MSGGRKRGRLLRTLLALVLAGALCYLIPLGAVLAGGRDALCGQPRVMIVLGCQVKPWGPSTLLQDRLDTALDYWQDHLEMTIVVSGGQGPDEPVSEAQCMYDYLTARGVPGEQILREDRSHNTWQNLTYSRALLRAEGYGDAPDAAVVSNGFHLTRVRLLWTRAWDGQGDISTLAAPSSHAPSRLKMYLREPLALVKSFVFDTESK